MLFCFFLDLFVVGGEVFDVGYVVYFEEGIGFEGCVVCLFCGFFLGGYFEDLEVVEEFFCFFVGVVCDEGFVGVEVDDEVFGCIC